MSSRSSALARGLLPVAALASAIVWVSSVVAAQTQPSERPQLAEEVFKNVQILKGIPVDQFMGTMGIFSASTGLNCTDCHLDESGGDWAKYADDNARKQMSRRMMQMVNTINQTNFAGRQVVTCFTCHRGASRPSVMPSIDLLYSSPPPFEPGDLIGPARGQPPVDQLFDKYLMHSAEPNVSASSRALRQGGGISGTTTPRRVPWRCMRERPRSGR